MLTLEEIRLALADRRLDRVSEATGVHANTLYAIRSGANRNPSYRTLKALSDYLSRRPETAGGGE